MAIGASLHHLMLPRVARAISVNDLHRVTSQTVDAARAPRARMGVYGVSARQYA